MFDLTTLDYIYVIVVLASTVWATIRGGIYETVATLSWVAAAVSARFLSPILDGLLQSWFELSESTVGTLVASYFIVFFGVLMIIGFFNQKLRDMIQASMMKVTDHTLGVIFGIIRGICVMGVIYWIALWYYSDMPRLPRWLATARTRPVMQLTALKLDQWFVPGVDNKLLQRDMTGTKEAMEIYNNLINPAVVNKAKVSSENAETVKKNSKEHVKPESNQKKDVEVETGYKSSERTALENQLLQIETAARAAEQRESMKDSNE